MLEVVDSIKKIKRCNQLPTSIYQRRQRLSRFTRTLFHFATVDDQAEHFILIKNSSFCIFKRVREKMRAAEIIIRRNEKN
jgi:hypothetical protein